MDVLKYFHEEPAVLGPVAAEGPGGVARGYLAGTHLPDGPADALRVGLTALAAPALYAAPLLDLWGGLVWTRVGADGAVADVAPAAALADLPAALALLIADERPAPGDLAALAGDAREAVTASVALLAGGARAVLRPEPAHDGHDLAVLAAGPLKEAFVAALRRHPAPGARRFVLPFRRARGEHLFYFEQWQLGALPSHVEEV